MAAEPVQQYFTYKGQAYELTGNSVYEREEQLHNFRKKALEEERTSKTKDSPAVKLKQLTGKPSDYHKTGYIQIGSIPDTKPPIPLFEKLDNPKPEEAIIVDLYDKRYFGPIKYMGQKPIPYPYKIPIEIKEEKNNLDTSASKEQPKSIPQNTNNKSNSNSTDSVKRKYEVGQESNNNTNIGKLTTSKKNHVLNTQKQDKTEQPKILKQVTKNLIEVEQQIKAGGNRIVSYEKDKQENIGAIVNTFPALRKDDFGEFRPNRIGIESGGSFVKYEPVPYVEAVENSRFPCGNSSVVVGNKYDLTVGAGGMSLATVGNSNITSGGRTILAASEEMNISSGGNNNIKAGSNLSLEGTSLTLKSSNQVVVDANLGVSKNAIINGCAFVDGELYINHITCPAEVQYTGGGLGSFGQLMTTAGATGSDKGAGGTAVIAYADLSYIKKLYNSIEASKSPWNLPDKVPVLILSDGGTDVASSAGNGGVKKNPEYSVFVYPHQHPFNNIPLSFTNGNSQMRDAAIGLNSGEAGVAKPISHGYKTPGQS